MTLSRDMYKEEILELYQDPSNYGKLKTATHIHRQYNPSCGDDITMQIEVKEGKIVNIKFEGKGCAISIASTSLLTDEIKGKIVDDVLKMKGDKVLDLLEIPIGPVRMRCALLPLEAVRNALGEKK